MTVVQLHDWFILLSSNISINALAIVYNMFDIGFT